ncbi:MAG TPA: hypothetical protein VFH68_10155 [Polyangia bacterium]|jgi:TolA-binding protein|nr:hypothetical protein [Polyangia bacterium]
MKRAPASLDAMVRAFRELTDGPADGAPTRARILVDAGRAAERRARLRRIGLPIAAAVVAISSVSAALPAAQRRWRAPTAIRLPTTDGVSPATPRAAGRAVRVIPPLAASAGGIPDDLSAPDLRQDEAIAYGRAHRAHFIDDAPARALAAWNAYLAAFPHGSLAPEASYNRAICLIRVGSYGQAARALRPFANGPARGYRRDEARQLLDWLGGGPIIFGGRSP